MSCEAVREALLAGRGPEEPELVQHAAQCPSCRALLLDRGALGQVLAAQEAATAEGGPTWPEMAALVEREVGWRAWLRSRSTPWRRRFGILAFALVTALGLRHLRSDFASLPAGELTGLLAAFTLTAVVGIRHALSVNGGSRSSVGRGLLATALAVPVVLSFMRTTTLTPPVTDAVTFARQASSCFAYGSLITVPLAVVLWLLDRGAASRTQTLLSAAVAGLGANAALTLHCPLTSTAHVLVGHAGIGLALAAVAWLLLGRGAAKTR
jgi:hypothetical protein